MLENVHGRRRRYNNLGTTLYPPDVILALVEMFFMPALSGWNRYLTSQGIRWHMVIKNQAESDRLPTKHKGRFMK